MGYKTSHERMIIVQEHLIVTGIQPTASGLHAAHGHFVNCVYAIKISQ